LPTTLKIFIRYLFIITITLLLSTTLSASTRSDVKIIEESENIRLFGQEIAKDYLFYYKNPKKTALKERLYQDIETIENSIAEIATITKNQNSKNILNFLAYNKDEIKELLAKNTTRERCILMIDYGEAFLEGANSILSEHKYKFSNEENMLMTFKQIEYLLERMTKYYVASSMNLDKKNNFENLRQSILKVGMLIDDINLYNYPDNLSVEVEKMNTVWAKHKDFLYESDKLSIPNLMLSSENILKSIIKKIALYHKQNQ